MTSNSSIFYESLALLTQNPHLKTGGRIEGHLKQLQNLAEDDPENYRHQYLLVKAELARISGQFGEAIDLYDRAIAEAKQNRHLREAALANELAAEFFLNWNKAKIAALYLREARDCYADSEDESKVESLEKNHPELLGRTVRCSGSEIKIKNIELEQQLKETERQLKSAKFRSDIDICLIQGGSLKCILKRCTDSIVRHLDAAFARIWTLNPQSNVLKLQASSGLYTHTDGNHSRIPVGQFKIGLIAEEKTPHLTNTVQTDPRVSDKDWAKREGIVSFAGYPLITEDRLVGVVALFARHTLPNSTLKQLEFVAHEIAIGIRRKQIEEALVKSERRLKEQTEILHSVLRDLKDTQVQLIQREKMSALGELIAGITHEINNPICFLSGNLNSAEAYLGDLIGHLQLYRETYPEPGENVIHNAADIELDYLLEDLPNLMHSMRVGIERIREISTSMRIFSRSDRDRKVSFDIHKGLDSTLLILKHRLKADEKRPEIKIIKIYGELPKVTGFPGQLNQVFMNLLANAIDAFEESDRGKSYAEIEASQNCITIHTSAGDRRVKIKIKDNACGMNPETIARIFEQGFTTKGVGKGTGLGMAIVHQIITEKHGGTIDCQSRLGEGTTFTIALPISGK